MTLITQKEYARRIKRTPQYVNKLVKQGKITLRRGLVDSRQADAARKAWARAGNDVETAHRSTKKAKKAKAPGRKASPAKYANASRPPSATGTLTQARAKREQALAEMAELDLKKALGELLPRDQVLAAEQKKNERIRTRFRRLPRMIAPMLAREMAPTEVEQILREEVDLLLGELAADPLGLKEDAPLAVEVVQTPAMPEEVATV